MNRARSRATSASNVVSSRQRAFSSAGTGKPDLSRNATRGSRCTAAGTSLSSKAGTTLANEAGTSLTNKAGLDLTNQAGTGLKNKAGTTLTPAGRQFQT